MTNEQINRAVAEELIGTLCWIEPSEDSYGHRGDCPCNGTGLIELDFCNDHNAVAEMRKAITDPVERLSFTDHLDEVLWIETHTMLPEFAMINANPRQQAEAFLRMRGKWIE